MITTKEQQIEALKGSIEKWEGIYNGTSEDNGIENCLCCIIYNTNKNACKGCPIADKAGECYCDNTPYTEWYNYVKIRHGDKVVFDETSKQLALDELNFLKDTLKELENE